MWRLICYRRRVGGDGGEKPRARFLPEWKPFVTPNMSFLACLAIFLGSRMGTSLDRRGYRYYDMKTCINPILSVFGICSNDFAALGKEQLSSVDYYINPDT